MTGVVWISRFPHLATYRYRAEIPSTEVAKHNGFVVGVNEGEADIAIFTKPVMADVEIAKQLKAEGAKIVVDLQDNHFHHAKSGDTQRAMAAISDAVICATETMRQIIGEEVGRDACVIGDPYEFEEVAPHAQGDDYLWFGHQVNFAELAGVMNVMGASRKLRVVTGPRQVPTTIPWSVENLRRAFAMSNIALFPTREGSQYKSPNRLINAIRQGCFAVCMMHPAYWEFRDYVWVGDFHAGLRWSEAFVDELNERVRSGQDYVRERFSPETIGKKWVSFLESL